MNLKEELAKPKLSKIELGIIAASVGVGISIVGICASILADCSWINAIFP